MNVLLDSSVFISFLNDTDVLHDDTDTLFRTLLEDKKVVIITPVLVFLEVSHILHKKLNNFDEASILNIFEKYEKIDITFPIALKIIPFLKKINLKTSDAILIAVAKLTKATLITWDKKLEKEAKKLANVQTPTTLLNKTSR